MQNFIKFHKKYFLCCKTVAFAVWGLRTSFGQIGAKRPTKSSPACIQFLQAMPHFMQKFKLNKMFYLNIRT